MIFPLWFIWLDKKGENAYPVNPKMKVDALEKMNKRKERENWNNLLELKDFAFRPSCEVWFLDKLFPFYCVFLTNGFYLIRDQSVVWFWIQILLFCKCRLVWFGSVPDCYYVFSPAYLWLYSFIYSFILHFNILCYFIKLHIQI